MQAAVFYSWQSDLEKSTNQWFVQEALERAVALLVDLAEIVIDRDTLNEPGAPSIVDSVLEKIDRAKVFVCDVSLIARAASGKGLPNPNVLFELGYAVRALEWSRIVPVMNLASGAVEELPFDLRQRLVQCYVLDASADATTRESALAEFSRQLAAVLREIFVKGVSSQKDFASRVSRWLAELRIYSDEIEERYRKPWVDRVEKLFTECRGEIQTLAASKEAMALGFESSLDRVVHALDKVLPGLRNPQYGGSWTSYHGEVKALSILASDLAARLSPIMAPGLSLPAIQRDLSDQVHRMEQLAAQAEGLTLVTLTPEFEGLKRRAADIGLSLLRLPSASLETIRPGLASEVRETGRRAHLLEIIPVDSELKRKRFVDKLSTLARQLQETVYSD